MTRYWTSAPKRIEDAPSPMWGCHVFTEARPMALCQAFGRSYEEAHDQAHQVIAAMVAVEQNPAVAAAARHYLVRSPAYPNVAIHCGEGTTLELAYDAYYDECDRLNRIPLTFDQWKDKHHG